jgi:hypothetical protein
MIGHKLPNKTKSATVAEPKLFHQLNNPLFLAQWFVIKNVLNIHMMENDEINLDLEELHLLYLVRCTLRVGRNRCLRRPHTAPAGQPQP